MWKFIMLSFVIIQCYDVDSIRIVIAIVIVMIIFDFH